MLKPQISILLPHLRNPINDRALHVCLECLMDNTDVDYELIVEAVSVRRDIYPVCNSMAYRANADYIIFHNSDVLSVLPLTQLERDLAGIDRRDRSQCLHLRGF